MTEIFDMFFTDEFQHSLYMRVYKIGGRRNEIDHYYHMVRIDDRYIINKYIVEDGKAVFDACVAGGSRSVCFHTILDLASELTKRRFPKTAEGVILNDC